MQPSAQLPSQLGPQLGPRIQASTAQQADTPFSGTDLGVSQAPQWGFIQAPLIGQTGLDAPARLR